MEKNTGPTDKPILLPGGILRALDIAWGVISLLAAGILGLRGHFGLWFWANTINCPIAFYMAATSKSQHIQTGVFKRIRIAILVKSLG